MLKSAPKRMKGPTPLIKVMDNHNNPPNSGSTAAVCDAKCSPASKWAALINDTHVPAPQRRVRVSVLKAQGGVPEDHTLFRDSSPRGDVPLRDDEEIDLAEGNIFYSRQGCFEVPATPCLGKPKLAFFVDDRHKETLNPGQTGESLRELFNLKEDQCLLRDLDSPNDDQIKPDEALEFAEGNVFITRCEPSQPLEIKIFVNTREKKVSQKELSFDEVVRLAFPKPPSGPNIDFLVTYRKGPACNAEGTLTKGGEPVKIQNGMCFNVSQTNRA